MPPVLSPYIEFHTFISLGILPLNNRRLLKILTVNAKKASNGMNVELSISAENISRKNIFRHIIIIQYARLELTEGRPEIAERLGEGEN